MVGVTASASDTITRSLISRRSASGRTPWRRRAAPTMSGRVGSSSSRAERLTATGSRTPSACQRATCGRVFSNTSWVKLRMR